jgi:chitinase
VGAKRKTSPVLIGAIVVALIALAGIFWMVRSSMSIGGKSSGPVAITIFPTSAKTVVGKSVDFVAEVTGAPTSDVTWSVEEGDSAGEIKTRGASAKEDTISLYCTYTAPQKAGTYHLVATSTADKSKSATAEITVAAK